MLLYLQKKKKKYQSTNIFAIHIDEPIIESFVGIRICDLI